MYKYVMALVFLALITGGCISPSLQEGIPPDPQLNTSPSPAVTAKTTPRGILTPTPSKTTGVTPQITLTPTPLATPTISPTLGGAGQSLYIAAWYATYDSVRGLNSFSNNVNLFNEINPVWYNLNTAYFTNSAPPFIVTAKNKTTILNSAKSYGILVLPTIQNFGATSFDATVIDTIINNTAYRAQHVSEIVNLVTSEGFDGIDIDYESIPARDCNAFSAFIGELGQALHGCGKLLSVTVYPKTSASANWTGPGAEDIPSLASYADSLKVMAYDYHWLTFHAGPISPLDWLQAVVNYFKTVSNAKGKVIMGLPSYGLNWGASGTAAKEVMYADALNLVNQYAANVTRESIKHTDPICAAYWENAEPHFNFIISGVSHMVYFQDAEALRERLVIINQNRDVVKGVSFWRLGGEDPGTWAELGKYK